MVSIELVAGTGNLGNDRIRGRIHEGVSSIPGYQALRENLGIELH